MMEIDREKLRQDIETTKLPFQCYTDFQAVLNQNKGLTQEAVLLVFYEMYCDPSLDELYHCDPSKEDYDKERRIMEAVKIVRTQFRAKLREIKTSRMSTKAGQKLYDMVEKVVVKRGKISADIKYFEFHIDEKVNRRKGSFLIPSDKLLKFNAFKEYFYKAFESLPPIVVADYKMNWAWDEVLTAINSNKQVVEENPEDSLRVYEANALFAKICEKGVTEGLTTEELADVEAGHLLHLHEASGAAQNGDKNKMSYFITSEAVGEIIDAKNYRTYVTDLSEAMVELGYKEKGNRNHRIGSSNPKCWELKKDAVDKFKSGDFV